MSQSADNMYISADQVTDSSATDLAREAGAQARIMWFDAEANIWALSTREGVRDTVARCKYANINTIIVDVKPLAGLVLYNSKLAPRLTTFDGKPYPADYDLLATVVEESHAAGIPVYAAINVFAEGSRKLPGGPAYSHPDWQCIQLDADNTLRRADELGDMHHAIFVNPVHPEVRAYALGIVTEIIANYDVDGIVLDRMRYPNLYTDFSDLSRAAFESHLKSAGQGHLVPALNWPADVIQRSPDSPDPIRGPLFKDWLKFRAQVMHDFLAEARGTVKSTRPDAQLGIYVGSWYPAYFDVGVNWGSPTNTSDYEWWPEGYETTGYADLVDFMCTGCYYAAARRADAIAAGEPEWQSVEAAAQESIHAVRDATFVYASLYLLQYHNEPERFIEAINECCARSQGCMLFDLVYARNYDWWEALRQAFPTPSTAPHNLPHLLARLRSATNNP